MPSGQSNPSHLPLVLTVYTVQQLNVVRTKCVVPLVQEQCADINKTYQIKQKNICL